MNLFKKSNRDDYTYYWKRALPINTCLQQEKEMESYKAYKCPAVTERKSKRVIILDILAGIFMGLRYPMDRKTIKNYHDMGRLKVSPKSELRINKETVLLVDDGIPIKSFNRDSLHIAHLVLHQQLYYVFSNHDIESKTMDELIDMINDKKSFCFPYVWQAEKDFPEMFQI